MSTPRRTYGRKGRKFGAPGAASHHSYQIQSSPDLRQQQSLIFDTPSKPGPLASPKTTDIKNESVSTFANAVGQAVGESHSDSSLGLKRPLDNITRETPSRSNALESPVADGSRTPNRNATPSQDVSPSKLTREESDAWDLLDEISTTQHKSRRLFGESIERTSTEGSEGSLVDSLLSETPGHSLNSAQSMSSGLSDETAHISTKPPPETPALSNRIMTHSALRNRSYRVARTILETPQSEQPSLLASLVPGDTDDDESSSDSSSDGGPTRAKSMKNFDDLRARGDNMLFIDSVGYIMEGLEQAPSIKLGSLLQLAQKCFEDDFSKRFKATNFPTQLISAMKDSATDSGNHESFLFAVILCKLLQDGSGIAASILGAPWLMPLLIRMLPHIQNIRSVEFPPGTSTRGFKEPFGALVTMLEKRISSDYSTVPTDETFAVSSSLMSGSALIMLQKAGPRICSALIDSLTGHLELLLTMTKDSVERVSSEPTKHNLELLYMLLSQLDFLAEGDKLGSVLSTLGDGSRPILSVRDLVKTYLDGQASELSCLVVLTLRILISLTTHCPRDLEGLDEVLDSGFSKSLVSFISRRPDGNSESSARSKGAGDSSDRLIEISSHTIAEEYLYASGLLVHMCESEAVTDALLSEPSLSLLKALVLTPKDSAPSGLDAGCLYLVLGLLVLRERGSDKRELSESDVVNVLEGLAKFQNSLETKWARGLQSQLTRVLEILKTDNSEGAPP